MNTATIQFSPRRALKAARILAANPDDLPQVFTIIESLSLDTMARVHKRLLTTEAGRRVMAKRADIVERLADREGLARLPEGSVGRAYLAFVEREGISADGIRAAAKEGAAIAHSDVLPAPLDYVHARLRDTHDLWHVVTGFSGDILGEIALLSFTFAQIHNPAIGLILAIGLFKTAGRPEARPLIVEWWKRGRDAAWLAEQPWEDFLAQPLDAVRAQLRIGAPAAYTQVRMDEIRAMQAAEAAA